MNMRMCLSVSPAGCVDLHSWSLVGSSVSIIQTLLRTNLQKKLYIYIYVVVLKIVNWDINSYYVYLVVGCLSVEFIRATESMIIGGCGCMKSQKRYFPMQINANGSSRGCLGVTQTFLWLSRSYLVLTDLFSLLSVPRITATNKSA